MNLKLHKMSKRVLCIIGRSGSGKTTLVKYLKKEYMIPYIVSYTTRERRPGEINGDDHLFVDEKSIPEPHEMAAYNKFGNNHYWVTKQQIYNMPDLFTYVIDGKGYFNLKSQMPELELIAVKIKRDNIDVDKERQNRDEGQFELSDSEYDIVVSNNTTIAEATRDLLKQYSELLILWKQEL